MVQQALHDFRKQVDECINKSEHFLNLHKNEEVLGDYKPFGREMSLARTKLQEAKMWLGKCLEALGSELPKEFQDKV